MKERQREGELLSSPDFIKGQRSFISSFSCLLSHTWKPLTIYVCLCGCERCVYAVYDPVVATACPGLCFLLPNLKPLEHKVWPFKDRDGKRLGTSTVRERKQKRCFQKCREETVRRKGGEGWKHRWLNWRKERNRRKGTDAPVSWEQVTAPENWVMEAFTYRAWLIKQFGGFLTS